MSLTVCNLSEEAALDLNGANIPDFLQGQLTCDTRRLTATESVAGALCNPKGRVISDVWCLQVTANRLLLRLRASVAEQTGTTLARYAQFSRISVAPLLVDGTFLGVLGDTPGDLATPALAALPETPGSVEIVDHCYWLRRGPRHAEVGAVDETGREVIASLAAQLDHSAERQWQAEDLRQGHYAIDEQDVEQFTPQALNYDLTGRVAFDKGCYTGQEVVARLHYKGQSKRRLRVLHSRADIPDPAGSRLKDEGNAAIGKLLRVVTAGDGDCVIGAELLVAHGDVPVMTESGAELYAVAGA